MDRKLKWRTFGLVLVIALAVCTLVPSLVPSEKLPPWFSSMFDKKVQVGLDLQGGLHITYSLDLDKAVEDKATEIKRDFEAQLQELGIEGVVKTPITPRGSVYITLDKPEDLKRIGGEGNILKDHVDSVLKVKCPAGYENSLCARVSSDYAELIKKSALQQAIETIRERINERGVAEPSVKSKGDQVIVELPGLDKDSIKRVRDIIERTAKLEFKMVVEGSKSMTELYRHVLDDEDAGATGDAHAKELGITAHIDQWRHDETGKTYTDYYLAAKDRTRMFTRAEAMQRGCNLQNKREREGKVQCTVYGREVLEGYLAELGTSDAKFKIDDEHQIGYEFERPSTADQKFDPRWRTYYLQRAVELGGTSIRDTRVIFNPTSNRPEVLIDFNRYGGNRFSEITGKNIGKRFAIILDDKITSAPVIQTKISGGSATITMGGSNARQTQTEADDLVDVLRTGALPAPLKADTTSEIGPLLGGDAVDKAKLAFMLGSILVVLIMVGFYRSSGVISVIALALNITLMMAILAGFGATLTLPGIAALVLTVGMAVDANIIIYERIREELRAGKSVRGAVDAGFARGLGAILDGNITTGLAAYVLFQYGSGPIKGFAVMLLIGIVCTLFTATWCTRLFFEYYIGRDKSRVIGI